MSTRVSSNRLPDRLQGLESSPTLALAAKAKALTKAGKPVLDFTAGEPDFPTPEPIKQAAIQAIGRNYTKYTPVSGIPELRQAIAAQLAQRLGVTYQPTQILVCSGAKQALYNALQALCQAGDEVIILSPYWVSYPPLVQLAGAKPVILQTKAEVNFQPDPEIVRSAITDATRAIILNSPSNPTGMLIDRACLAAVAKLARQRDLVIISDEIYDQLVFSPHQACSILQADPSIADRTILVNGVSKSYSMTGWRIGYAAGPASIIDAMGIIQSHSTSNPASISQYAALEALTGDQRMVADMLREFHQRRDRLVDGLNRLPGLSCPKPQGAFYAWCHIGALGQSAAAITSRWVDELFLVAVPGEGFGTNDYVRFSFATSPATIDEGLKRLSGWLSAP